ncbi:uncharacterized protein LOC62_03G003803 [Vanrija pseudolonga]|uniref:DUF4246 domain-containing protein n=1 Tax=Vanrija pseudolonga TaxID=143232 RepID=A0AAF0Y980_9TREE|nr:hypothetical protein LOC62_03G003803 [Vanrija pseudolonga]
MFNWCIWELQCKARGLQQRCDDTLIIYDTHAAAVFKRDPSTALRVLVSDALAPLEQEALAAPGGIKAWETGRDETSLMVVQPAMYAFEYGRTPIVRDREITLDECLSSMGSGEPTGHPRALPRVEARAQAGISCRYQLLPADVELDAEGKSHITSYINDVHPVVHVATYRAIETLLDTALPLFAAADDSVQPKSYEPGAQPGRFQADLSRCTVPGVCEEGWQHEPVDERGCKPSNYYKHPDHDPISSQQAAEEWFVRTHPLVQPQPLPSAEDRQRFLDSWRPLPDSVSVLGKKLQIIVSVKNVVLTPQKPRFPGTEFHVQGLINERVSGVAVYCYDSDNVTESRLSFAAPAAPVDHRRDPGNVQYLYGISQSRDYVPLVWVTLGSTMLRPGGLVVFPNVLAHRDEPLELADSTRPGFRKTITVCLVDPHTPILSTVNVPPQQRLWAASDAHEAPGLVGPGMAHFTSEELLHERSVSAATVSGARLAQEWSPRRAVQHMQCLSCRA